MKAIKGMTGSIKEMQSTICCSDDLTNIGFIKAGKGNYVHKLLKHTCVTFNAVCRVMGLHPSWKKSHLHLIISEYNSRFAQRMRPIISYLKWLKATFATREVSSSELECKDLLSSVFEFFERGANLGLIEFILEVARVQIVSRLKTRDVMPELCKILNCDNNALPIELVFLPTKEAILLSTCGPEYLMYNNMSTEMALFCKDIYSRSSSPEDTRSAQFEPLMKHKIVLYRDELKEKARRRKLVEELSISKSWAENVAYETSSLRMDYGSMPLNVAKILNEGQKDEFDVAMEGMTLMNLVEAMGIASERRLGGGDDTRRSRGPSGREINRLFHREDRDGSVRRRGALCKNNDRER